MLCVALGTALASAATVSVQLVEREGGALDAAAVVAYPLDASPTGAPLPATLDQRDRKFVPHLLIVETHARVTFSNSDRVTHHVYSFSPAKRFQLYLEKGKPAPSLTFDRAGVVTLGCNIHDWMLGYILVVDSPYFGKTDGAGSVRLTGLPAGRYRIEIWHPRVTDAADSLRREVVLAADDEVGWSIHLAKPLLPERDQEPGLEDYEGGR